MGKDKNNKDFKYASAPYNFIPFPEKIVYRHKFEDAILNHEQLYKKLETKTGYIDYSIEVKTPLFIGNGEGEFFKVDGEEVIPGSTVRGKIRSNCEILASSYPEFVEDKKLWYRGAFSKDVLNKMYKEEILSGENGKINEKVKAGYLIRQGSKWFITPAQTHNDKYFKEIHESKLRDVYHVIDKNINKSIFMYKRYDSEDKSLLWNKFSEMKKEKKSINKEINKLKIQLQEKYNKSDDEIKELKKEIKTLESKKIYIKKDMERLLKNNEVRTFKPYYYRALYDNDTLKIKKVMKSVQDKEYGFLMNSARLNSKQNHYLIFKKDITKNKIEITKELISQYKTSVKCKQSKPVEKFELDEEKDFYENKEKPIFYLSDEEGNITSFGFTPYLKISYKKGVQDGIKTKQENIKETNKGRIDYVKGIFGFENVKINNNLVSYKGRVSFTNARCKVCSNIQKPILKHLMNPKISSFQLYLKQDVNDLKILKTYSSKNFELRGQKIYWLRNESDSSDDYESDKAIYEKENKKTPDEKQYAKLSPIDKGTVFNGRIYFENLDEDELGLLLMAIKPFKDAKENLGQGKPYGFGKVEFKIENLKEVDNENRFKGLNLQFLNSKDLDYKIQKYINKFIDIMNSEYHMDFSKDDRIRAFKSSKLEEKSISYSEFNYMDIKEFKDRKILKDMNSYIDYEFISAEKYVAAGKDDEFDKKTMAKRLGGKFRVTNRRR